jgi:4-carboxymuconolactone decarboxylase
MRSVIVGVVLLAMVATPLQAQQRLGAVPTEKLDAEQRAAIETFKKTRGADLSGPFEPMLWSPEAMVRTAAMGDYLRFKSAFPPRLSEFIILLASRQWSQQYEWSRHHPIAIQAGIDRSVIDAIAEGRRPQQMSAEHDVLWDFCTELMQNKSVSDTTYNRTLKMFGEKGIIDAVSITGYYTFLAMVLNTVRLPAAPGAPRLP